LCDAVGLPVDLRGKRVLDIGAWHGCFSFECERRGASEGVALTLEPADQSGFDRLRDALGSKAVRLVPQSIYAAAPTERGACEVVLCLGVRYHLRYPLLAIYRIRNLCTDLCLVETFVIDNCVVGPKKGQIRTLESVKPELVKMPIWQFFPGDELHGA